MTFIIQDRIKFYSILLNTVLSVVIALLIYHTYQTAAFDCDSCAGREAVKHDTIYPKDIQKEIIAKVPEAFKTVSKKKFIKTNPAFSATLESEESSSSTSTITEASITNSSDCDSIRLYCVDTTIRGNIHLSIEDTVEGKIIGRSVWLSNLKPEITTTIKQFQKETIKFYLGGTFTINQRNMDRWGVGPSALLTIPKIGGISYYFDAKNFSHSGTFFALIRFHK